MTHQRFRKALILNNLLDTLPYRTPLQPYTTYFSLTVMILLTLTNGFYVFVPANWNVSDFLVAYITLPIFLVLYLGHKAWFRTSWAIRVGEIDVWSGKEEADRAEEEYVIKEPRNRVEKAWGWVA